MKLISGVNLIIINNPIAPKILEWLYLIERCGKLVRFCWVQAHVAVVGNELADNLAKQAAHSNQRSIKPLPYEDHVHVIKREVRSCWQFCWDLETSNKLREITSNTCLGHTSFSPEDKK